MKMCASTVRELAASVVMVGIDGLHLDEAFREAYRRTPFAGIILFGRNVESVEQVRALTDELRALGDPAPLIAIDQEGGRVSRIRGGVEEFPPMMALGATGSSQLCEQAGEQLAFDLRRAGVTVDYAPVLDLAIDPMNTVIGARAFGSDPKRVGELGLSFLRGMERGGMKGVVKHFPGHGATSTDSHLALPVIEATEDVLRKRDLAPFKHVLAHASIMSAHVIARALDPQTPATLSKRVLTDLLRGEWGYDGAVFTDCLTMDAIARFFGGTVSGAASAIAAGADCALISHGLDLAEQAVDAIAERVSHERLREASQRVMRLRTSACAPLSIDAKPPFIGVGRTIAQRAVTHVRGDTRTDLSSAIVVSFQNEKVADGAEERIYVQLWPKNYGVDALLAQIDPAEDEVEWLLRSLEERGLRPIVLARRAHVYDRQLHAIRRIVARYPEAIVISTREPFDIPLFSTAKHVLAIYGDGDVSLAGLFDVLSGRYAPQGALPVEL